MDQSTFLTPFQILILVFGVVGAFAMATIRLFINSLIRKAFFTEDDKPKFVSVDSCINTSQACQLRLLGTIDAVKKDVKSMKGEILTKLNEMNKAREDARKEHENEKVAGARLVGEWTTRVKALEIEVANLKQ